MRKNSRVFSGFSLTALAVLLCPAPAHAGMIKWMDDLFTFREEQKPLVKPHRNSVPKQVLQPSYPEDDHVTWSSFYTRADLEPQDYLSSSASKVMRPRGERGLGDLGGFEAINQQGMRNGTNMGDIMIGAPGEGPGVRMSDARVGRATQIGPAVYDWREGERGSPLESRPGDYDYRMADVHRPEAFEENGIKTEILTARREGSMAADKGVRAGEAARGDKRYASFDAAQRVTAYVVQKGDMLSTIAAQPLIYNDGSLWPLIYSANRSAIGKPTQLKVGTQLVIPRDFSDAQARKAGR